MAMACHLVVDCREAALIEALDRLIEGVGERAAWSVRSLDVGDALITRVGGSGAQECPPPSPSSPTSSAPPASPTSPAPLVLVERKTLADLCASIKDGRYREQKARLLEQARATGAVAAYVLEGYDGFGGGLRTAALRSGLHEAVLQTCVCRMAFVDGIRVLCTRNVQDTAECLRALWSRAHRFPPSQSAVGGAAGEEEVARRASACVQEQSSAMLIHAKRGRNITPPLCFRMQLCQIPGVSEKIAGGVAARWGTMAAFYERMGPLTREDRVKALVGVPLVGKKNAQRIEEFMFVAPTE